MKILIEESVLRQALETFTHCYAETDRRINERAKLLVELRAALDAAEKVEDQLAACQKDAAALWMMLDDIDTGGDIAKADDVLYRAIAERSHKRRFEPRYEWVMKYIDATMKQEGE